MPFSSIGQSCHLDLRRSPWWAARAPAELCCARELRGPVSELGGDGGQAAAYGAEADWEWRALRRRRNCGACVPATGTGTGGGLWDALSGGLPVGAGEPAQNLGCPHAGGVGQEVQCKTSDSLAPSS